MDKKMMNKNNKDSNKSNIFMSKKNFSKMN